MHAALLTIFVVTGAGQAGATLSNPSATIPAGVLHTGCQDCCCVEACGCHGGFTHRRRLSERLGPMPQTCYAPRFGCYSGNNRHMHRYPAFHGYYYREPYNYRRSFDYPWRATPHEPMGFFMYQAGHVDEGIPTRADAEVSAPEGPSQLRLPVPNRPRFMFTSLKPDAK